LEGRRREIDCHTSIVVLAGAILWGVGAISNHETAEFGGFVLCIFGFGMLYMMLRHDRSS
jgi:hypothetical protein